MTTATCREIGTSVSAREREDRPDRLAELLECLADLVVETERQRAELAPLPDDADPSAREALARLGGLERTLQKVSMEAATVHQLLQQQRLI
jgi:hypothetical protein